MSTLAKNIRALRSINGITQTDLARALDLQRSTVTKWETGAILNIRTSHLEELCESFGLSKDDILSSENGLAAQLAAMTGEVDHSRKAGYVPLYALDDDLEVEATSWVELPQSLATGSETSFCVEVRDQGVNRTLPAGCIALVEPADEEVSGKLCLVELDDGERIVRRVHAGASNSMLSPESWTMRDDVTLGNDKLRVIGTIAWWMGGSAHVVS
jgi:transcriptional regulator with XRE-family HTH domain